jgi:SAM-dependent methyltransferase
MANENMNIIGAGQDTAHRAPKIILDACCGSRAFWFDKQDKRALFVDKRAGVYPRTHSDTPRAPVVVAPDWQGSFTDLPFPNNTFCHVVFDPPHIVESSESGNLAKYYGVLRGDWRVELRRGFAECFRVLCPGGTLIFKWNELSVPVREILALTPEKPLYGHKSGKLSKTHWIAFMKGEESPVLGEESPAQDTVEICHTAPNTGNTPCCYQCGNKLDLRYWCYDCNDMSHPA